MKTQAYKIHAAKAAGLTLRTSRGHTFWDGTPDQWDIFEWFVSYYQHYKTIPSGNYRI